MHLQQTSASQYGWYQRVKPWIIEAMADDVSLTCLLFWGLILGGLIAGAAITIAMGQVKYTLGYKITMGSSICFQDYMLKT